MKLLLFFLFSITVAAQNFYPDTIVYNNNNIAGNITEISESLVRIEHSPDKIRVASVPAVTKIVVGKLGLVYYSGFIVDVDAIKNYLANRTEVSVKKLVDEKQLSPHTINENLSDTVSVGREIHKQVKRKWSFGVLLIPYYSGNVYSIEEIYNCNYLFSN